MHREETPPIYTIYLEIGTKRVFAGAVAWPGWCRAGRDEAGALQALLDAAPRYQRALASAALPFAPPFAPPASVASFQVVERLAGNATTDFGAPAAPLPGDDASVGAEELARLQTVLCCCWHAFDAAVSMAAGRELQKGPRGGGRELQKIVEHVLEADGSYLASLGWKLTPQAGDDLRARLLRMRQAMLEGLEAVVRGEVPALGPRGGTRWAPRTYVRRVAWHVLDHAWEVEDRVG